jgi:hypothetical protein
VHLWGTWTVVRRVPKTATAADLCRKNYAAAAPSWISYTFEESKLTDLTATRHRLGNGGDVQAQCRLVRVEDKWLVATVAPGFEGKELVGRVIPGDAPSAQALLDRAKKIDIGSATLLPYEFNGVDGTASDQRQRFITAGGMGVFGVLGLVPGVFLLCGRRKSAPVEVAPANKDWMYHSVANSANGR